VEIKNILLSSVWFTDLGVASIFCGPITDIWKFALKVDFHVRTDWVEGSKRQRNEVSTATNIPPISVETRKWWNREAMPFFYEKLQL